MASKMYLVTLAICIVMSVLPSQSIPAKSINEDSTMFDITSGMDNVTLKKNVGDVFTIRIRGNPTTGYGWYLSNRDNLDRNVIKPLNLNEHGSGDYETDAHPEGMVGVGGYYYFKFEAVKETDLVTLKFEHKRPWETEPIRTVNVNVNLI